MSDVCKVTSDGNLHERYEEQHRRSLQYDVNWIRCHDLRASCGVTDPDGSPVARTIEGQRELDRWTKHWSNFDPQEDVEVACSKAVRSGTYQLNIRLQRRRYYNQTGRMWSSNLRRRHLPDYLDVQHQLARLRKTWSKP